LVLGDGKYDADKSKLVDVHIEMLYPKEINALVMILGPMGKLDAAAKGYDFGQRVDDADKSDEAIVSEAYRCVCLAECEYQYAVDCVYFVVCLFMFVCRPGYTNIKGRVPYPGSYTVVLSTYTPDTMVGPFRATFACSNEKLKVLEVSASANVVCVLYYVVYCWLCLIGVLYM